MTIRHKLSVAVDDMDLIKRAFSIYREQGIIPLIQRTLRWFRREALELLYQLSTPDYVSYSVGRSEAEFDAVARSYTGYDFTDDLETERPIIRDLIGEVDSDDVFYDIGANIGIYTCLVGTLLEEGQVVAFEPNPGNFEVLQNNVQRNNLNASLYRVALSGESGRSNLKIEGKTAHHLSRDSEGTIEVETRRADHLIEQEGLPTPNICKIDIEGAEYQALLGLRETLSDEDLRLIYCEVHEDGQTSDRLAELNELLDDYGFSTEILLERRSNVFIKASRD